MNECEHLRGRYSELKEKVTRVTEVNRARGTYTVQMIDARDLFELAEVEKQLGEKCWTELDPGEKFDVDREKFFKDAKARLKGEE